MTLQIALPANAALIPADAFPAGTRLEDYEIDRVIARSAVALVYRAVDRRSNQLVAIKEFLPTGLAMRGDDGRVVARETVHEQNFQRGRQVFHEEAKSLAKIEHACLMRVLGILECHGTVYKVMPYCPAQTLLEHRQNMASAPTDRLLRSWLEGLLGALAKLHEQGKVHGAVSPGNILMLPDNRPLLLDSDAVYAAILSDRTRSMIAALEPCFAPQEQCEPAPERPIGPWTDLYAVAATLHFCVSGQLPGTYAQRPRGGWFESAGRRQASAGGPEGSDDSPWTNALEACLADSAKDRPQGVAHLRRLLGTEGPVSTVGMTSAQGGLAPMLSSPVPKSPAWADRPAQALIDKAALDDAPDVPGASQLVQQAARDVAQMSLPLILADPKAAANAEEAEAGGATPQPDAVGPPDEALVVSPGPAKPADGRAVARPRIRTAGVVASLLVVLFVAGAVTLFKGKAKPDTREPAPARAAQSTVPAAMPAAVSDPVSVNTRQPVAPAASPSSGSTDARVDAPVARTATPKPPQSVPALPKEPRKPVAAKDQSQQARIAAKSQVSGASPRQACAGKERYALLQCMETQCAKKAWTNHEQCVRLRKDRKL